MSFANMRVLIKQVATVDSCCRVHFDADTGSAWSVWRGHQPFVNTYYDAEIDVPRIPQTVETRNPADLDASIRQVGDVVELSGRVMEIWSDAGEAGVFLDLGGTLVLIEIAPEQTLAARVGDHAKFTVDQIELWPFEL